MKRYLLLGLLGATCAWASAQTLQVVDLTTMAPLPHVQVIASDVRIGETDAKGKLDLSGSQDDQFSLTLEGYEAASASRAEITEGKTVYMAAKSYTLDEVVLSASRFQEKREDVAQNVTVLRSRDLAFMNQSTSADVLQNTGEVLVQKSQLGGGSPIIRGFETNKVLLVVDGVRMNNAIYRGGHLQNVITLDNAVMDRVEVLFGPGSTVYGSDALGGVMSFYTKKPTLSTDGKLLVKANAFGRYGTAAGEATGHADVSLGTKRFGSLTSVTYSSFGDLRQGHVRNPFYGTWGQRNFYQTTINGVDTMITNPDVNVQVGSGYSQYDVMQKFVFAQSAKVTHTLNLQLSNSSDLPRYDRLTQMGGNGLPRYAEWYYGPQRRLFGSYTLGLTGEGKAWDNGRVIVAYQNIEESRHDRRFGSDNFNHRTEQLSILSLNADFAKKVKDHEVRYGLEGIYNTVNSTAERTHPSTGLSEALDTRYPDGGSSMNTAALYATHSWELKPGKLILNDGLRLSYVGLAAAWSDTTFFPFPFRDLKQNHLALNGNLGLVYMPGRDYRFSLLGSTGFRAPNVDDLSKVFESVPGNVIVPNPELGPERTYNLDLGLSKTFAKEFTIGGNVWATSYQHALTTARGTFNGQDSILYDGQLSQVITTVNAASAYLYGASGTAILDIGAHFRLLNTLNFTYGRINTDTTDYPLDHIPPLYGKSSLQVSVKQLRAEFYVMYSGWKRLKDYNLVGEDNIDNATPYGMPAWVTLNVRAAYQVNRFVQVQVALENIADQNYRVFASNIGAPGRNLTLTLRGSF